MDRVLHNVLQGLRGREVVAQATNGVGPGRAAATNISPHAQQVHKEVAAELVGQHLEYRKKKNILLRH